MGLRHIHSLLSTQLSDTVISTRSFRIDISRHAMLHDLIYRYDFRLVAKIAVPYFYSYVTKSELTLFGKKDVN